MGPQLLSPEPTVVLEDLRMSMSFSVWEQSEGLLFLLVRFKLWEGLRLNVGSGDVETNLSLGPKVRKKGLFVYVWGSVKVVECPRRVIYSNTG